MPVFTFLPDYIKSIFITSSSIKEQYSFVYDVSMGIILSALFYFIVDVIPEKIKIHKAKKILSFQNGRKSLKNIGKSRKSTRNIVLKMLAF